MSKTTILCLAILLCDCATRPPTMAIAASRAASQAAEPAAVVPDVQKEVQPQIVQHASTQPATVMSELALGQPCPAQFKTPVRLTAVKDPWKGMAMLERHGLNVAAAAKRGPASLGDVIDALSDSIGKPAGVNDLVPTGKLSTLEDHVKCIQDVLEKARGQTKEALAKLTPQDRNAMFTWTPIMLRNFSPQLVMEGDTKQIMALIQNDLAYCGTMQTKYDWAMLAGSARTLLALADPKFLQSLAKAAQSAKPLKDNPAGVTGEVLYCKDTPSGLIIIGGKGKNTYSLPTFAPAATSTSASAEDHSVKKPPVALILDLGGDDAYKGVIASSFDAEHPNSVVIDLSGNDTYDGQEIGLACGRCGVGLLVDCAGNDTYKLAPGSGGCGYGGIGILCDLSGDDTYTGCQYTQGIGFSGVGLLIDYSGNDTYTSFGWSIGLGGPCGVGAVVDVAGNDSYQCGKKIPSGYNSEQPQAKPGEAAWQWDAFGMGIGIGRRILTHNPKEAVFSLAGGVGMVIDTAGNDRYESSNFSQACGYFFGAGLKLDLDGNDVHRGARYSHAAGAHFGMGLFVDYSGDDRYETDGPTYNCGCSWDHSVFMCIDAGRGNDVYDLARSHGLGQADIGAWGVFADMGGIDRYTVQSGLGNASQKSLGVFYHGPGRQTFTNSSPPPATMPATTTATTTASAPAAQSLKPDEWKPGFTPADKTTFYDNAGGLFISR